MEIQQGRDPRQKSAPAMPPTRRVVCTLRLHPHCTFWLIRRGFPGRTFSPAKTNNPEPPDETLDKGMLGPRASAPPHRHRRIMTTQSTNLRSGEVRRIYDVLETLFRHEEALGTAALYTEQGTPLPAEIDTLEGKNETRVFWRETMDTGLREATLNIVVVDRNADAVVGIGHYRLTGAEVVAVVGAVSGHDAEGAGSCMQIESQVCCSHGIGEDACGQVRRSRSTQSSTAGVLSSMLPVM